MAKDKFRVESDVEDNTGESLVDVRDAIEESYLTGFFEYSGTRIGSGQSGKSFNCNTKPHRYDTQKYYLGAYTNGNLTGFVNAGGYDCIIMKVDHTGKILA